jgi:ribosome biogenesis GTPase
MNLTELGWNELLDRLFEQFRNQGLVPGRVARQHRHRYLVYSEYGELEAEVSGRFRHAVRSRAEFPTVGDWVAISGRSGEGKATICALLPRSSSFSRKAVLSGGMPDSGGETDEQVLAANVDTVFLVSGLDHDFNLRRIERYLTIAWDSGAVPVILLNKVDLCGDVQERIKEVESIAPGVAIHPVSATRNDGFDALREYLVFGKTVTLLGSSGVGKSTLVNSLLGEERLKVGPVRAGDSRGRHVTAYRQMILLPTGGIVIDTPGMRTLSIWDDEGGLKRTFDDVEQLAVLCRFRDCRHEGEPGCAVGQALKDGTLDVGRYRNYLKLQKELRHLARRKDKKAQRRADRAMDKKIRQHMAELKNINKKWLP